MDPVTVGLVTAGGLTLSRIVDYLPDDIRPTNYGQLEREERMKELQERHRLEDKNFQIARDKEHERFQLEVEAQRMSFQEHLELRRLQFQVKMEKRREEFQTALQARQFENNREIAQFQARAMRETQILVSRENAKNMLENQMVLEALKSFPLNISPLVLLNNRPHSLSSLLRFTIGESIEIEDVNKKKKLIEAKPSDVLQDVMNYANHPEALNIFIAPVFVDSKMPYQKTLSTRIWEMSYQKIESFFTKYYSKDGNSPVMFYPTAWNDKYTAGVHASETLHYFLKDLPCMVLEPKFDGNKFRLAISFWGLGYGDSEHHRIETEYDINIDLIVAYAAYQRSKDALSVLDMITKANVLTDSERRQNDALEHAYLKNIKLFEALHLGELNEMNSQERKSILDKVAALGINKLFSIDNTQDIESIASFFADQIGVTLALYADIHHFISTGAEPKLPEKMSKEGCFKSILADADICESLYNTYKSIIARVRNEECSYADAIQAKNIEKARNYQIEVIQKELNAPNPFAYETWQEKVRGWVKRELGYENDDFNEIWGKFISKVDESHRNFVEILLSQIDDEDKQYDLDLKRSGWI